MNSQKLGGNILHGVHKFQWRFVATTVWQGQTVNSRNVIWLTLTVASLGDRKNRSWRAFQTTGTAFLAFSSHLPGTTTTAKDHNIVVKVKRNKWQTTGEIARHVKHTVRCRILRFAMIRKLHENFLHAQRPVRCITINFCRSETLVSVVPRTQN